MTGLIETLVQALVDHPEDVKVTREQGGRDVIYRLTVHAEDVGKVIGKQGRVAKAIRTVVYAAGHNKNERITLEIQ
ncbi:KH domain-containing protein [Ectobacillus ponti]|uniref:RNA-binding protein KhpA n=1 Tax=Ectobacillus ponti TaxID=2961894 RepID=A0AA41XB87_9BACI|nr:KH domain-containing protein [Ectobacillus ponti]MCP8970159.1 KH domain-containing protein [Ectobacillus ponti]